MNQISSPQHCPPLPRGGGRLACLVAVRKRHLAARKNRPIENPYHCEPRQPREKPERLKEFTQ